MPFCPHCRDEFEDEVKECPDCGVLLVEKLPDKPKSKPRNDPLVYVATAPNEGIAGFWQGILEENGIRSVLKGADMRAAMYSLPFNQYQEIYVLASDAAKAKGLLEPFIEAEEHSAHAEEPGSQDEEP